jgi:hypothetical protein
MVARGGGLNPSQGWDARFAEICIVSTGVVAGAEKQAQETIAKGVKLSPH